MVAMDGLKRRLFDETAAVSSSHNTESSFLVSPDSLSSTASSGGGGGGGGGGLLGLIQQQKGSQVGAKPKLKRSPVKTKQQKAAKKAHSEEEEEEAPKFSTLLGLCGLSDNTSHNIIKKKKKQNKKNQVTNPKQKVGQKPKKKLLSRESIEKVLQAESGLDLSALDTSQISLLESTTPSSSSGRRQNKRSSTASANNDLTKKKSEASSQNSNSNVNARPKRACVVKKTSAVQVKHKLKSKSPEILVSHTNKRKEQRRVRCSGGLMDFVGLNPNKPAAAAAAAAAGGALKSSQGTSMILPKNQTKKRGRGRPKKEPAESKQPVVQTDEVQVKKKRGPGRPRKVETTSKGDENDLEQGASKKKQAQPRENKVRRGRSASKTSTTRQADKDSLSSSSVNTPAACKNTNDPEEDTVFTPAEQLLEMKLAQTNEESVSDCKPPISTVKAAESIITSPLLDDTVPPPAKRRGRPPKKAAQTSKTPPAPPKANNNKKKNKELPIQRRRSPRMIAKNEMEQPIEIAEEEAPQKKSRGRKRKSLQEDSKQEETKASSAGAADPPKRKRGRPKKSEKQQQQQPTEKPLQSLVLEVEIPTPRPTLRSRNELKVQGIVLAEDGDGEEATTGRRRSRRKSGPPKRFSDEEADNDQETTPVPMESKRRTRRCPDRLGVFDNSITTEESTPNEATKTVKSVLKPPRPNKDRTSKKTTSRRTSKVRIQEDLPPKSTAKKRASSEIDADAEDSPRGWDEQEVQKLRDCHKAVDPRSRNFWDDVAEFFDGSRTTEECRDKWFSLINTPNVRPPKRSKKQPCTHADIAAGNDDDDIFQSTPMRRLLDTPGDAKNGPTGIDCCDDEDDDADSIRNNMMVDEESMLLDLDGFDFGSAIKVRPVATDHEEISAIAGPQQHGYKTYLKGMAKSVKANTKLPKKGLKSQKLKNKTGGPKKVSASSQEGAAHMSPGGTVRVETYHDDDDMLGGFADDVDEDQE